MGQRVDFGKQDHWLKLVQLWQRSGLSVRDFCERHRLSEASFYSWRRVLRERGLLHDEPAHANKPAFVKLTVAAEAAPSVVEVVLGKRVLRVRPGFDADLLLELVRLLEEPAC
jgi:transposase-like protein